MSAPSPPTSPSPWDDGRGAERQKLIDSLLTEGCYCIELDPPLSIREPLEVQVRHLLEKTKLVECNPAMARMYGMDSTVDLLGKSIGDLFLATDMKNGEALRQFVADRYQARDVETHEVDREGKPVYFLNNVFGVVEGEMLMRLWGTQRDITPQRRADDVRLLRESRYSQMLDHLELSVFMKDKDLRVVAVNRRHCGNLGKSEAELLGKTDFELYPRDLAEKYRADDLLVLTQERKVEMEEQTLIRGELRTVRVIKSPVRDSLGRVVGVLGVFWDVTDQRAMETQFRHAQKMDAIGQLAAGVANDFNNMVTAMLGNLDLLGKHLPPDGPLRGYFDGAEAAALRASSLIGKLLSFSRRAPLKMECVDLAEQVRESLDRVRRKLDPRIRVELRLPEDLWAVHADANQVQQILFNLCLNAADAMPGGGTLLAEALNVHIEEDYLRGKPQARPGDFVCLQVSDTGVGIPDSLRSQLFEPFVTTKEGGQNLGLGLAMVYGMVERHGGWIEFQTAENLGTTFSIYLPRFKARVPTPAPTPVPAADLWGQETILFVEDEEIIRKLGSTILSRHGYKVRLAADGHEALRIYSEDPRSIDLVVLDLSMPGLSGRDVYRRLKSFKPDVKVIFTSGQMDELAAQAQEDPALGCIGKPYRAEELARLIRSALDVPGVPGLPGA